MNKFLNIIVIVLFSISASAANWSEPTGVKGYWNYEIKPIAEEQDETHAQIPPAPLPPAPLLPTPELMKLHPDQIQALVKQWRKHAIYTQDVEDATEALRIQDVARKKASSYAATIGLVNQINPNLSLADEVPITNAGRQTQFNMRKKAMNEYLSKAAKQYGLLYFSSKTCEFCRVQDGVLQQLLSEFKFDIDVVEFEKVPVMAQRFNIKQTPSIIIVNRYTKKHLPIAFGVSSLPSLKENIYRAIRYIQKEITPQQFFTNEKDIGTGLDPTNKQE